MVCLKLSSLTRALNSRKRVMEVLPNNMVRLETLDGKPKHMMTTYASLKPLRPRTHPGWPKDSPSAPVLPGDAEMLTSSSEEETECHCFMDHTYAGPTSPWKKELHPDQKQLLEYVLACDRPATELIVKEGGVCLTQEEFWSLGLSRDMDSTIGDACLQLVQEAAQRHVGFLRAAQQRLLLVIKKSDSMVNIKPHISSCFWIQNCYRAKMSSLPTCILCQRGSTKTSIQCQAFQ
ncbi:uncharacterized protein LOC133652062 isoform X3 [Entelurus aequoreus]|uniref:uncharacterized protein LOC133652062 isoform X3 n=1 Tax=Entelurus aequoreus TaxID=161455 RepID=UPI002B1E519C|nr:uncharacterized protein LOC133652062 isoform X3 [Entelurus aequoreus]